MISVSMQSVADTVTTPMDGETHTCVCNIHYISQYAECSRHRDHTHGWRPHTVHVTFIISVSMQSVADTVTTPMDGDPIQVCVTLYQSVCRV